MLHAAKVPRTAAVGVQSVERAIALLKAVAAEPEPATAAELAIRCGINRSTAWRLLNTLEDAGLVERDPLTQRYRVGYAAFQVASAADDDAIARRVRPILARVAAETGEIVTLAAARRFSLVYVDQADPPNMLSASWMGRPIPLHATSSGKVFLAWLPEQEREALLAGELEAYTARTITDHDAARAGAGRDPRGSDTAPAWASSSTSRTASSAAVLDRRMRPRRDRQHLGPSQRVTRSRLPALGRAAAPHGP